MSSDQQLTRRIAQFESLIERLQSMWHARHKDPECYLVIDEFPVGVTRPKASYIDNDPASPPAPTRLRGSDSFARYAQLAFHGSWFYLELPDMTLSPSEGERLAHDRPGFFHLKDRPDSPSSFGADKSARLVRELNPVHKCYRAGDKVSAATDLAYLWFTLWRLPADWVFQAKLSYFARGVAEVFPLM